MRILVVEDDKGTARFIKKGLSEEGFLADVVSGGEEGLFMATTEIYDLIILDVMLPEINGFEILRAVRKKGVSTPVLFLTAKDEKEDIIHGLDLGVDDYPGQALYICASTDLTDSFFIFFITGFSIIF